MTEDSYHFDYESFSEQPLGKTSSVGAYRYASDPSTEILIMAIAKNDEDPVVWDVLDSRGENLDALMLMDEAVTSGAKMYAHNAQFEHALSTYKLLATLGINPPSIEQLRCTATMARLAAIPSSLAGCGEFLEIEMPKDKEGIRLINKFSSPRKPSKKDKRTRIMPEDDPEDFALFVDYCCRDVVAERQVQKKLHRFEMDSWSLDAFRADLRMNDRGIPVNRDALTHASKLMEEYLERLVPIFRQQVAVQGASIELPVTKQRKEPKFVDISEGFNPTQREMFFEWLKDRGFKGLDLTAETVEKWIKEGGAHGLTKKSKDALHTYSLIASAAVKKIPAMLAMACEDGFVRGALMLFGAERSHRWTGKGIQPQNYARPRIGFTELAYFMVCQKCSIDEIESICGNFFDVLVSVIRHFIQPHDGEVLQADYSSIEARIAPWLVNAQDKLDRFERGDPIYEQMAARIFGGSAETVSKDERFVGKQAELGCSYNMGRPKFRGTCESYGFEPSEEMVEAYKPRHKQVVEKAINTTINAVARKYEKVGKSVPSRFDTAYYAKKCALENGWADLGCDIWEPKTQKQWIHFTYDDLADRAVTAWRADNPLIVKSWGQLDRSAKAAIEAPGKTYIVGRMKLRSMDIGIGENALCLRLPSGHSLVYPRARVEKNPKRGWGTVIKFWGVIPNSGGKWGWCSTYGGKLLENATQGCAGDVMRCGLLNAEKEGYLAFMLVHDEILTQKGAGQSHERLCELLCHIEPWMEGLPLAAEGATIPFYKK